MLQKCMHLDSQLRPIVLNEDLLTTRLKSASLDQQLIKFIRPMGWGPSRFGELPVRAKEGVLELGP